MGRRLYGRGAIEIHDGKSMYTSHHGMIEVPDHLVSRIVSEFGFSFFRPADADDEIPVSAAQQAEDAENATRPLTLPEMEQRLHDVEEVLSSLRGQSAEAIGTLQNQLEIKNIYISGMEETIREMEAHAEKLLARVAKAEQGYDSALSAIAGGNTETREQLEKAQIDQALGSIKFGIVPGLDPAAAADVESLTVAAD